MKSDVVILGVYAADLVFQAERMPKLGETTLGRGFAISSGGKGSNQAVAAALAEGRPPRRDRGRPRAALGALDFSARAA